MKQTTEMGTGLYVRLSQCMETGFGRLVFLLSLLALGSGQQVRTNRVHL